MPTVLRNVKLRTSTNLDVLTPTLLWFYHFPSDAGEPESFRTGRRCCDCRWRNRSRRSLPSSPWQRYSRVSVKSLAISIHWTVLGAFTRLWGRLACQYFAKIVLKRAVRLGQWACELRTLGSCEHSTPCHEDIQGLDVAMHEAACTGYSEIIHPERGGG